MQFIETLKLKSKLFLIFALVTISLIVIGIVSAINISQVLE